MKRGRGKTVSTGSRIPQEKEGADVSVSLKNYKMEGGGGDVGGSRDGNGRHRR